MNIHINHIGYKAQEVLQRSAQALVSGIASRGIYLQLKDDWTLYLSQEKFRGPLTLNLEEGSAKLDKIKIGCFTQISTGELHFPDEEITISLEGSNTWHPSPVDSSIKFNPENLDPILSLAKKIDPENPYLPLLFEIPGKIPGVSVIGERIQNLQTALKSGDPEKIAERATRLLGLGPGLTPLGDDFLLGVLLALNRWGHQLSTNQPENQRSDPDRPPSISINNLNRVIQENTQLKTTKISSSLFACAAEGAADERLLAVLDGLFSGASVTQNEIRNLLRWGSSSGITVLAGMISVFRTKDAAS